LIPAKDAQRIRLDDFRTSDTPGETPQKSGDSCQQTISRHRPRRFLT
jgi:hypothetical protein